MNLPKNGLEVTNDVTGHIKVKMLDFSGVMSSASKISMLSENKANESAWLVSLTFDQYQYSVTLIQVKAISSHQVKKIEQKSFQIYKIYPYFRKDRTNDPKTLVETLKSVKKISQPRAGI